MTQKADTVQEKNARGTARGRYFEWLYRRFRNVQLLELIDSEPGHINLRQIFVPLRADHEDIDEERMTDPEEVEKEKLPGQAVWDLLVQEPFVALSGRPGSGKTTVVHAIVMELCGRQPSDFRKQLAEGRGIAPIPLILRNLPGLESVQTLEELLDIWWREAEIQAKDDQLPLDIPRLKDSFDREKAAYPALLLFDGIDEVGGPDIRNRIFKMAVDAIPFGFRVLVTGRPTGFQDLPSMNEVLVGFRLNDPNGSFNINPQKKLYHVLPFAWEQIQQFIHSWYGLRNEWKRKREAGIDNFLNALQDQRRRYLLTLARRPIFLTLMALVHCSRNEMPDGRGALYKAIIDLYLVRQENHRQLKEMNDGRPMPHWSETEKRMVLGFLAYQSQIKGGEQEPDKAEKRRVVWKRQDMLEAIRGQLSSRKYGRFTELLPEDAEDLLRYFLHPAGLLTEPEEERIQFAHLSFQEYLCADYLSGRCKRKYITQELFSRLNKPGWDEVGLLLLTTRAEQERNEGHFEILSWLDLSDVHQAGLFIKAYTGRDLPFTEDDLEEWLPVALGCTLLHPEAEWMDRLARLPEGAKALWSGLLVKLFEAENAERQWDALVATLRKKTPFCLEDQIDEHAITDQAKQRWMNPKNDGSWPVVSDGMEARTYALLNAVAGSGGGREKAEDDSSRNSPLLPESRLAGVIADYLERNDAGSKPDEPGLLWLRKTDKETGVALPGPTNAAYALDVLLPEKGGLWEGALRRIPLDAWLLQGEAVDVFFFDLFSQPAVLLSLFPKAPPP